MLILFLCFSVLLSLLMLFTRANLLKLHRLTKWSWPLRFLPVSGGTSTGPNTEIDLATQLANMQAAIFQNGIATNPVLFQGALALGSATKISASAAALPIPGGSALGKTPGVICLTGGTIQTNLTLALPVAGAPSAVAGGQDGTVLIVFNDTAAKAWEFSGPGATTFQGSLTHCTMSSTASTFSAIVLFAYNGSWWVLSNYNCTLS